MWALQPKNWVPLRHNYEHTLGCYTMGWSLINLDRDFGSTDHVVFQPSIYQGMLLDSLSLQYVMNPADQVYGGPCVLSRNPRIRRRCECGF